MTSNERLDQLEPLLADSLQKIDRLIEGQGRIINEVSKISGIENQVSKIPHIETNLLKTAEAVAKLTVSTQEQYKELKVGQEAIINIYWKSFPKTVGQLHCRDVADGLLVVVCFRKRYLSFYCLIETKHLLKMKYAAFFAFLFLSISCQNFGVDPAVDTLRVPAIASIEDLQVDMAVKLYQHYSNSDKSREFYEVISKNRGEILNYNPAKQLLTACADPGSNWIGQFKDVDLKTLKRIGQNKITFPMYYDSLVRNPNSEYIEVKTNGNPSL